MRGMTTETKRSMNSYMRLPRRVTVAPTGWPARRRNEAIDLRARRTAGFWPVMVPSSSMTLSRALMFWVASPTPELTTIFSRRGTIITLASSRSFCRAGTISFLYRSYKRLIIMLLVQHHAALAADALLAAGRQLETDAHAL